MRSAAAKAKAIAAARDDNEGERQRRSSGKTDHQREMSVCTVQMYADLQSWGQGRVLLQFLKFAAHFITTSDMLLEHNLALELFYEILWGPTFST